MATKKKMLQAAAGNAGGGAGGVLNVEDVFSTYLYTGTSGSLTVNNGIDLLGEGGMVWHKGRDIAESNNLFDTERGDGYIIRTETTQASDGPFFGQAFTSTGFSLNTSDNQINSSSNDYVSWTFRKAPKFFDVVTYTGTGSAQNISHSLGSVPGMILTCNTGSDADWGVYHRQLNNGTDRGHWRIKFNSTGAQVNQLNFWNDTAPTDSVFTVGTNASTNATNNTYVAYLFAHNDGDGEFGPDGDADIIKCGSYTGTGAAGNQVTLGWEPQWLLIKRTDSQQPWPIVDIMRGAVANGTIQQLRANQTSAESTIGGKTSPNATGFALNDGDGEWNASGGNYIYMAIRRGTKVPESATEVFDVALGTGAYTHTTGFPVDLAIQASRASTIIHRPYDRLRGGGFYLETSDSTAEANGGTAEFDNNTGYTNYGAALNTVDFMWKRAPGFCDVVAYTGDGVAGRTVSHNLGVAPEMMWVKSRSSGDNWYVYHKDLTSAAYALILNQTAASLNAPTLWNSTAPTDSVFTVGSDGGINGSTKPFIAYLFATLPGVSKVGSYTGTGTSQTIDCGFTSGARFVLLKRTDSAEEWRVFDTARGIIAGNDPLLNLNSTGPEEAFDDLIDPYSAGFSLTGSGMVNTSGGSYIFYAIA